MTCQPHGSRERIWCRFFNLPLKHCTQVPADCRYRSDWSIEGASQHNSYVYAVNSTYLMAAGAQGQIFSVLSTMGITMGYSSVIYQPLKQNQNLQVKVSMFGMLYKISTNLMNQSTSVGHLEVEASDHSNMDEVENSTDKGHAVAN